MEEQYLIKGSTLDATADAIREKTHHTTNINPLDFPEEILGIDLTTEEYMRLSDLIEYPEPIDEHNYTRTDIRKVDELTEHLEHLGEHQYVELPYLFVNADSNYYIATNLMPENITVEADIELTDLTANNNVFGTQAVHGGDYYHLTTYSGQWYWGLNNSETHGGTIDTLRHDIIFNDMFHHVTVNGTVIGSCEGTTSYEALDLFRRELWGDNIHFHGKVYEIKVSNKLSHKLLFDLKPVQMLSDNKVGLLNVITNIFYPLYEGDDNNGE